MATKTKKTTATTEYLTLDQLADIIHSQARKYLDMSGLEFMEKYADDHYSMDTNNANILRMYTGLAEGKKRQSLIQRLRKRSQRDAQQNNHDEPSQSESGQHE
ncbi:MAG: hypothetical protein HY532_03925 [Chloroflexi bacterium]|nr:hypothetical protein [Chloroflexota bacterium]